MGIFPNVYQGSLELIGIAFDLNPSPPVVERLGQADSVAIRSALRDPTRTLESPFPIPVRLAGE